MIVQAPFQIGEETVAPGERRSVDLPVSVLSDHTPMTLTLRIAHGKHAGPTFFVSAAIHGDEIIGVEIIRRLLKAPQIKSLKGTLICAPVVNAFGFINHTRYLPDRRDLNRSFPGAAKGSLASRLARLFMTEVVLRSSAGIDLHSAAIHRENLPQIRIDAGSQRVRQLARRFSPPVILQSKLREGSMRMAAREKGIDVLVYEAGEALRFDETAIRLGVRGVLRVLHEMEMIPSDRGLKPIVTPALSTKSDWLRAPMGGVLRAYTTCGKVVAKGDVVAAVGDPLGDREVEVTTDFAGLVVGRTHLPVVNEGDALFHVAEIAKPQDAHGSIEKLGEGFEGDPLFDEDEIL